MVDCQFHLISLPDKIRAQDVLGEFGSESILISGVPHGWVLEPHGQEAQLLLGKRADLFILSLASNRSIDNVCAGVGATCIAGEVEIPRPQYDVLVANRANPASPSDNTPPLSSEWWDLCTGQIPSDHILPAKDQPLEPGELKLYQPMVTFLSSALPPAVRDKPVGLFNLFKYRNGDSAVHEHYMQGFKDRFGPAAGAQLKFMGPVTAQPGPIGATVGDGDVMSWQDANLVQYDSIWHYAHMLSTDVYAELNKEKIRGLEDTCILLISEVELQ